MKPQKDEHENLIWLDDYRPIEKNDMKTRLLYWFCLASTAGFWVLVLYWMF